MASTDTDTLFSSTIKILKNVTVEGGNLKKNLKNDILHSIENLSKVYSVLKKELEDQKKINDEHVKVMISTRATPTDVPNSHVDNNLLSELVVEIKSKNIILIENKTLLEEKIVHIEKELEDCKSKLRLDNYSNILCQKSQHENDILKVSQGKDQNIDENKKTNNENHVSLLRPSYKETLIMKTKVNKTGEQMKMDLIKNMDTKLFKEVIVRNSRMNGNIILQSNNSTELEKVTKKIKEKLNDEIDISTPKQRLPRIKIKNVVNVANLNDDDLIKMIANQNDIAISENSHLKVIYKTNPKNEYFDMCIEVDVKTFAAIKPKQSLLIGFVRCKFYESFNITRCFKCNDYSHRIKDCEKNEPVCGTCAEIHETRSCESLVKKCINCIQRNATLRLGLNIDHPAWSHECPTYIAIVQSIQKKMNYSE